MCRGNIHGKISASRPRSLAFHLAGQAALGIALGVAFCLLVVLLNPSNVTSLIAHDLEPRTTAIVLVSFFTLVFGVGATLTGIVVANIEKH